MIRKIFSKHSPYLACLATGLFSFYNLLQLAIFNVISNQLLTDFQLSTTQLGFLSSCFLWANALGLIPIGLLLDRYNVRRIALSFLSLTSLASLIIGCSHSLLIMALMRSLQGLASAASLLTSMRLAIRWFDKKPHLAVGFIVVLALCGGIVGNYGFSYLLTFLNWRTGLIIAAGLGGLISIVLLCFLYDNPRYAKHIANSTPIGKSLKSVCLQPQNLLGGILIGLLNSPIFVLATLWGNFYLSHLYHISMLSAASLSSVIFLGVMCGSLGWGYIADNDLSPYTVLKLGCRLALLLSSLVFSYLSYSLLTLALLLFCLGFASSSQNTIYTMINRTNLPVHFSTATGIATLLENGVGALLQIVVGLLLSYTQDQRLGLMLFGFVFSLSLGITYYLGMSFNRQRPRIG